MEPSQEGRETHRGDSHQLGHPLRVLRLNTDHRGADVRLLAVDKVYERRRDVGLEGSRGRELLLLLSDKRMLGLARSKDGRSEAERGRRCEEMRDGSHARNLAMRIAGG